MSFTVRIDGRHAPAIFETLDEAVGAAKRIVDAYLSRAYEPGMSGQQLWESYALYGEVPFIASEELTTSPFSAWRYASERIRSWKFEPATQGGGPRP